MKPPSIGARSGEPMPLGSGLYGRVGGDLALLSWRVGGPLCSRPYCWSAGVLSNGLGGLLVFLGRGAMDAVPHGSGVLERPKSMSGVVVSSGSLRPMPKSFRVARRRGFMGGTGGGLSIPFLKEAPGGRSTVSTFEVEESNATGSEISCLLIVFLRRGTWRSVGPGGIGGGVGELATGDGWRRRLHVR